MSRIIMFFENPLAEATMSCARDMPFFTETIERFMDPDIHNVMYEEYFFTSFKEEMDDPIDVFYENLTTNYGEFKKRKHQKFCNWIKSMENIGGQGSVLNSQQLLKPLMKELDLGKDHLVVLIDKLRNSTRNGIYYINGDEKVSNLLAYYKDYYS